MNIASIASNVQNLLATAQTQGLSATPGLNTNSQSSTSADGTQMFKDVFNDMISNVNSTDSAFQGDIVKAAEGELDNPQQLLIDSQKANIALQLTISVRNKALDAYSDIVKMQV
ncbi:MAG: flagellar hook-basal body complex protein FliE [Clostridia bacterium]|nr:flagellar hook-basal body complex protein FliE [Clostridia bacterium]